MVANIVSRYSYTLTDVLIASDYSTEVNGEYDGKSRFTFHRRPNAEENDFIILKADDYSFQGIISEIENGEGKSSCVITALEMPALFDQKVILTNETLLQTGIEDFIANQIRENFIANNDEIVNIPYLEVVAKTHTPVAAKVSTEKGIYNLCTYIGNALTNYGIFMDFEFSREKLVVTLEKRGESELKIDTGISDIVNLSETYDVRVLSKLTVVWQRSESAESKQIRHFYLRTDRTLTENMHDADRAKGSSDIIVSESETEAGMIQDARNAFTSNSYNHKIAFDLIVTSKLIPLNDVYVGRKCLVKTSIGIKETIITKVERKYKSRSISVTLGNMRVTLIEKLKGAKK